MQKESFYCAKAEHSKSYRIYIPCVMLALLLRMDAKLQNCRHSCNSLNLVFLNFKLTFFLSEKANFVSVKRILCSYYHQLTITDIY